jgi:hypothetical protein
MSFDLNIKNYKKRELEDIFELPATYDKTLVTRKENFLREKIVADNTISEIMKQNTFRFLKETKDMLIADLNSVTHKLSNIYNTDLKLQDSSVTVSGNTPLIDRPVTPYGQSSPSEFYSGIINPLKKRTIRQNLNIDTRFRDNYTKTSASNFQFDLPTQFNDVMSIQLDNFEFTTPVYNISAGLGNNFFSIEINTGEMLTIIIPGGIYTDSTLITAINLAITNIPLLNNPATYQIVMTQNSIRCSIFTNSSVSSYEFTLFFQGSIQGTDNFTVPLPFKLGWIMGFRLGLYTSEFVYTSEGSIDLYGPKYIYLVFDDYNNSVNNGFFSAFNKSILNNNILARISMTPTNTLGAVIQNNLALITFARQYFGPVNINKVNIQLLDEYGRILDMHSMDYSFCVTFNVVYDL